MFARETRGMAGSPRSDHGCGTAAESAGAVIPEGRKADLVLPAADTKRWSSRRKAAVVVATRAGIITRAEACQRYTLSDEELAGWEAAFDKYGIPGLRITTRRSYGGGPFRT